MKHLLPLLLLASMLCACAQPEGSERTANVQSEDAAMTSPESPAPEPVVHPSGGTEIATLGAGCFWCVEAVLEQLDGVESVESGYMGGRIDDPSYRDVCTGATGHAEVVQVRFDPAVIPYEEVLDWFWRLHDPTTLNRQGADVGTQYRSAIFVHSPEQREIAEKSKAAADASGVFAAPIVTEVTDASTFWVAEEDHQDYYRLNKTQGYCRMVIRPKLEKLGLEE